MAGRAADRGIRTALSTNGTLITPEVAHRIKESGIAYVGISLDGATEETHDRFRNSPGSFRSAVAAFAGCREAGLRCGVRVTLNRGNFNELEVLVDRSVALGASRFCLYWLVPSGRGIGSYDQLQLGRKEVTRALDLLYRKAKEIPAGTMEFLTVDAPQDCVHLLASMEQENSPDLADARGLLASLHGGCSAGRRVANIDPQGNVYPCQFARLPEFHVGNIRDRPFSRIWSDGASPVLARFRDSHARFAGRCSDCRHRELCGGGCRVRAYAASGDFLAEDPFCYVTDRYPVIRG